MPDISDQGGLNNKETVNSLNWNTFIWPKKQLKHKENSVKWRRDTVGWGYRGAKMILTKFLQFVLFFL